jgi:hypothetical protein
MLKSLGFLPEITVEDFPPWGKSMKLHVKRRRWTDKNSGDILQRDWNLFAKGTRMTQDFAEFFKKNQPILKHFPAKQLENFMALMAGNFKDNIRNASVIIKIRSKDLTQKIT